MDEDEEFVSVGEPIPRLAAVRSGEGRSVIVKWESGETVSIDLTPHLNHKAFKALIDDKIFSEVLMEEYGWSIYWPSTESAAIPTTTLQELERGTYGRLQWE